MYSVFLFLLRVSGISSPFFIQKLSSWVLWALVRLHCSVRASSMGSVACSDWLMDGSVEGEEDTDQFRQWAGSWLQDADRQPRVQAEPFLHIWCRRATDGKKDGRLEWEELFWGTLKCRG